MKIFRTPLFLAAPIIFVMFGVAFIPAHAQTSTATVLQASSACTQSGCVTTLTATVTAGTVAVHPGLVIFCDGAAVNCEYGAHIGTAQLLANGTVTFKVALSAGAHSIRVKFQGTKTYSGSESSPQVLTITPPAYNSATTTTISALGVPGSYALQGQVAGSGSKAAVGTVSFVDTSNNNAVVASALLGSPTKSFTYQAGGLNLSKVPAALRTGIISAATGDFNNDGFQDVALVTSAGSLNVLLGNGAGSFSTTASTTGFAGAHGQLLAGDFNSDGRIDLAISGGSNHLLVALGNGNGTFAIQPAVSITIDPALLYLSDLNKDGIPDIVALNTGGITLPLIGKGDGTFTSKPTFSTPNGVSESLAVADFDGDGVPDLVIADDQQVSQLAVFLHGNGDGTFTANPSILSGFGPYLVAGDFDGDGIPDLMGGDYGGVSFVRGNGDGTFAVPSGGVSLPTSPKITGVFAGDFNGDGILDVAILSNPYTGQYPFTTISGNASYDVAINSGNGSFAATTAAPTPSEFPAIASADFTGDDIPDLLAFTTNAAPTAFVGEPTILSTATSTGGISLPGGGAHNVVGNYSGGDGLHSPSTSAPLTLIGTPIEYTNGFAGETNLVLNGGATLQGNAIQLTDGKLFESRSFFYQTRVPVASFNTSFDFQIANAVADGFAFVVEANGPNALGSGGGGFGYGNPPGGEGPAITNSFAVAFDLHNNLGEGNNSIRLEANGLTSTSALGSVDLTPYGIDLHSGHPFNAQITVGGYFTQVVLTDLQTNKVASIQLSFYGPSPNLTDMGYVGFTAGTGATSSALSISNWTYTPGSLPGTGVANFPVGFAGATKLALNGGAAINGSALQLTHGTQFESASVFYIPKTLPNNGFNSDFDFDLGKGEGDGFTFTLQNNHISSVGGTGDGLGYSGIPNSAAIKFDLHNNAGEGTDSTGVYINGALPTVPSVDITPSGVNLHSGHTFHAHIQYRADTPSAINLTITDLTVYKVFEATFTPDIHGIPSLYQGFVGFTAGTGETPSSIKILNWTYVAY